jgi:hypothetical protein
LAEECLAAFIFDYESLAPVFRKHTETWLQDSVGDLHKKRQTKYHDGYPLVN